ncbi:MAG: coenzyme F420-0:L-glutamate ligase [Candidatus Dormibacteraeota bacterium]|nr:coenzyme F420-0:L-glutamate ligase [Candidatus Dormibacteraeota bacterium]
MSLLPVEGLPEVRRGDDLAALIAGRFSLETGDVLVVAQKVVSKAEGRLRRLAEISPGERARKLASGLDADPRFVQAVLDESVRVVRSERVLIVETRQGYVCANAGIDHSNVTGDEGEVLLLPEDCDRSAASLREALAARGAPAVGVIVADTFGRAWRTGIVNVALGVAGLAPLIDYRGRPDDHGRILQATVVAVADELAAAAELVMGKVSRVPAVVVRGWSTGAPLGTGRDLIRPAEQDLFR